VFAAIEKIGSMDFVIWGIGVDEEQSKEAAHYRLEDEGYKVRTPLEVHEISAEAVSRTRTQTKGAKTTGSELGLGVNEWGVYSVATELRVQEAEIALEKERARTDWLLTVNVIVTKKTCTGWNMLTEKEESTTTQCLDWTAKGGSTWGTVTIEDGDVRAALDTAGGLLE